METHDYFHWAARKHELPQTLSALTSGNPRATTSHPPTLASSVEPPPQLSEWGANDTGRARQARATSYISILQLIIISNLATRSRLLHLGGNDASDTTAAVRRLHLGCAPRITSESQLGHHFGITSAHTSVITSARHLGHDLGSTHRIGFLSRARPSTNSRPRRAVLGQQTQVKPTLLLAHNGAMVT